jgi:hypothetical protein
MSNIDNADRKHQRGSEQAWLGQPLTTGVAMALLGANLVVMLAVALYIAHRLDRLNIYMASLNRQGMHAARGAADQGAASPLAGATSTTQRGLAPAIRAAARRTIRPITDEGVAVDGALHGDTATAMMPMAQRVAGVLASQRS